MAPNTSPKVDGQTPDSGGNKNERSSIKNKFTFVYFVVSFLRFKREKHKLDSHCEETRRKTTSRTNVVPIEISVFLVAAIFEDF